MWCMSVLKDLLSSIGTGEENRNARLGTDTGWSLSSTVSDLWSMMYTFMHLVLSDVRMNMLWMWHSASIPRGAHTDHVCVYLESSWTSAQCPAMQDKNVRETELAIDWKQLSRSDSGSADGDIEWREQQIPRTKMWGECGWSHFWFYVCTIPIFLDVCRIFFISLVQYDRLKVR